MAGAGNAERAGHSEDPPEGNCGPGGDSGQDGDDIRNTQREMYENQQKSQDRESLNYSQYMRGTETYRNPGTGETFDLDSKYGHAWVNDRGEYLLSDQGAFNPNTVQGNTANWTQLEHVKN